MSPKGSWGPRGSPRRRKKGKSSLGKGWKGKKIVRRVVSGDGVLGMSVQPATWGQISGLAGSSVVLAAGVRGLKSCWAMEKGQSMMSLESCEN